MLARGADGGLSVYGACGKYYDLINQLVSNHYVHRALKMEPQITKQQVRCAAPWINCAVLYRTVM